MLLIYVDDMLFKGNNPRLIQKFTNRFNSIFFSRAELILGVDVLKIDDGLYINQSIYISDLLDKVHLNESKNIATIMMYT